LSVNRCIAEMVSTLTREGDSAHRFVMLYGPQDV
jgi:hypothetical protein